MTFFLRSVGREQQDQQVFVPIHALADALKCVMQPTHRADRERNAIVVVVDQLERARAAAHALANTLLAEQSLTTKHALRAIAREADVIHVADTRTLGRQSVDRFVDALRFVEEQGFGCVPVVVGDARRCRRYAARPRVRVQVEVLICSPDRNRLPSRTMTTAPPVQAARRQRER